MTEYRKYSIKQNRFKRSFLAGFETEGDNTLRCKMKDSRRFFICDRIDGIESGAFWGRLHMDWELDEDMVVIVHTAATDERAIIWDGKKVEVDDLLKSSEHSVVEKLQLMEQLGAKKQVNQKDFLLYGLKGRYLHLMVEVRGLGEGFLTGFFVTNQGDILSNMFPEICTEYGSFYHRYMSVFSTLHMDFQDKIDKVSENLDIDTAPVSFLPMIGKWMGLDINGDFLSEDKLRMLVKEAYRLNRIRGTKEAILRVCEIVLEDKVVILEKNVEQNGNHGGNFYEKIHSDGIYDVMILTHTFVTEKQKSQLMFLLNQLKPVRSRLRLKYLEQNNDVENSVYPDRSVNVMDSYAVVLDESAGLDADNILL